MAAILITIALFAILLVYFRIADEYNIIDKPNERSSHTAVTLRGGGIIFPLGALLFMVFYGYHDIAFYLPLTLSILLIGIVSFCDDVKSLSNTVRILCHLIAVSLMLYAVQAFTALPWWLIPVVYVIVIGIINAYNFMDGINGITGLYSLSVLLGCLYFNHHIRQVVAFEYITIPIIACIVFLFFNFRKKAKCFAGDVGSISIGLWIISLLLLVILATNDLRYILFLAVYGVDSVFTIIHRLMLRQNIFKAHRLHFYQILANQKKMSHLVIAAIYGVLQITINAFIIHSHYSFFITCLIICLPLALLYVILKPLMMKQ